MSDHSEDGGRGGSQSRPEPGPLSFEPFPAAAGRRRSLWLLLVPALLFCAAPLVANRIEPRVLGVPFLLVWIIGATVLSPLIMWTAARLDPAYRSGALEPVPADDPAGATGAEEGTR